MTAPSCSSSAIPLLIVCCDAIRKFNVLAGISRISSQNLQNCLIGCHPTCCWMGSHPLLKIKLFTLHSSLVVFGQGLDAANESVVTWKDGLPDDQSYRFFIMPAKRTVPYFYKVWESRNVLLRGGRVWVYTESRPRRLIDFANMEILRTDCTSTEVGILLDDLD